jgi:hypothetical protein
MSIALPGPAEVAELLAFLPRFREAGFQAQIGTNERTDPDTGRYLWIGPIYHPAVVEFFNVLNRPCWLDKHYQPRQCNVWIRDPQIIANADLAAIRAMLTYCNRQERVSEGTWGASVQEGYIEALLVRMEQLAAADASR